MDNFNPGSKIGTYIVRVLPPVWEGNGDPFVSVTYHHNLGKDGKSHVVCPNMTFKEKGACPICDHTFALRKTEDPLNLEQAKKLKIKPKVYANVIVKGYSSHTTLPGQPEELIMPDEQFKTQILSIHWGLYMEFLSYLANPQYGDITSINEGFDFVYTVYKDPKSGFNTHKIQPFRNPSAIAKDPAVVQKLSEQATDLTKFQKRETKEKLAQLLDETIYLSSSSAPVAVKEEKPAAQPAPSPQPAQQTAPTSTAIVGGKAVDPYTHKSNMPCYGKNFAETDPLCGSCVDAAALS